MRWLLAALVVAAAVVHLTTKSLPEPVEVVKLPGLDDADYAVRFRSALELVDSDESGLDARIEQTLLPSHISSRGQAALEFVQWKRSGKPLAVGRQREGGGPNILLISIDTLRADHLGCYGYHRSTSPNIDGLAEKGVLFENAFSPASWTLPAHMSIFTALYPSFHKLETRRGSLRLDSSERTIAASVKGIGYRTVSFVTHPYLAATWGFDQGFDLYWRQPKLVRASEQTKTVFDWLDWHLFHQRHGLEPSAFFLFVHYIDPHETYNAPKPFRDRYTGNYEGLLRPDDHLVTMFLERDFESQADYEYALALYDGEISYVDHEIGRLLERLDDAGLLDSTVVALTSDHGEEFKEHGSMGHKTTVYTEQLHVPLIITYPPRIAPGQRVSPQVALVDIYPTLLGLIRAEIPARIQGVDLGPLFVRDDTLQDPRVAPTRTWESPPQFAEHGPLGHDWEAPFHKRAIRTDRYKLIVNYEQGLKELFDIRSDPKEQRNLYPSMRNNAQIRDLEQQIAAFIEAGAAYSPDVRDRNQIEVDERTREQLRALGYAE